MPLPLVLRKLISPVEVKLVLSAFSEEMRQLEKGPQASLGSSLARIMQPMLADVA
jgi:hypothetical protein